MVLQRLRIIMIPMGMVTAVPGNSEPGEVVECVLILSGVNDMTITGYRIRHLYVKKGMSSPARG